LILLKLVIGGHNKPAACSRAPLPSTRPGDGELRVTDSSSNLNCRQQDKSACTEGLPRMNSAKNIKLLQRLIDRSSDIKIRDSSDPTFRSWKNNVERTLIRVFGDDALEVQQFRKLRFYYRGLVMSLGADYSREHREHFDRDFSILLSSIAGYIEELEQDDNDDLQDSENGDRETHRVFISHASQDSAFVEELIDLLELIGLPGSAIFCTSFAGYGIDLGENFLDSIKDELSNDTLVLFVLSEHFYSSPVCLCEMGATWVQTKDHIPILVPPFDFADVRGVVPLTQGFRINDPSKLNVFKEKIEAVFKLPSNLNASTWERKRDRIVERLNSKIASASGK
jgi:hypothetical protein